jgi:hypothetical protein
MKSITLFFIFFISAIVLTPCKLLAQEDGASYYDKVSLASPNAAALGKYGDIPVSNHTGVADINMPLYTVKEGPLTLPITLNYHTSGLKVAETASWVGAGWSLNAGGMITRAVKGLPDDLHSSVQKRGYFIDYGYMSYPENWNYDATNPFIGKQFNYIGFQNGQLDSEPDMFNFNFNGYSGKFYFRDDRTPILTPEQDIKIEYDFTPGTLTEGKYDGIRGFIITTPDGVKYYFGRKTNETQTYEQVEITRVLTGNEGAVSPINVISTWYLYKIVSADQQFSINLNYEHEDYGFHVVAPKDISNTTAIEYTLLKNIVRGVRLSSITCSNGAVVFNPGASRLDLSTNLLTPTDLNDNVNANAKTLGSISVKNNANNEIKRYDFNYDYFYDPSALTGNLNTYVSSLTTDQKRLKLLSIQEAAGTLQKPPYIFDYFTETVPRRLSFGRDHWGFINGVTNNSRLISTYSLNGSTVNAANRESAWPAMRGGTLKKITYPTGGFVSLDYEANTFYITQPAAVNATVGGLRIKTITKNDGVSGINNITDYSYGDNNPAQSSGILYSKPAIIQVLRNDLLGTLEAYGPGQNNGCYNGTTNLSQGYVLSPTSVLPLSTTQGYHIGYSQVKVSQSGNGYSMYRYYGELPYNIDRNDVVKRSVANDNICDASLPNWPAAPLPYEYIRGNLKYEGQFNNAGMEVKKTDYYNDPGDYVTDTVSTPGFITSPPIFNLNTWGITNYDLFTARKVHQKTVETNFDLNGNNGVVTTTEIYFESPFHHQATSRIVTNSKGETVTTKYRYAQDLRISTADNISDGYIIFTSAKANLSIAYSNRLSYCGMNPNIARCKVYAYHEWLLNFTAARQSYISALKQRSIYPSSLSQYLTNFNNAKSSADAELKPFLEMHTQNILRPITVSTWINNNLVKADLTQYSFSSNGAVYPSVIKTIDLTYPSATFTGLSTAANNINLTKDSRYVTRSTLSFSNGNITEIMPDKGTTSSYIWDYKNNQPIASTSNAPANQTAYTSFEADGKGNWAFNGSSAYDLSAPTGKKVYILNTGAITKDNLTAGKVYTLSYWSKDGSYAVSNAVTATPTNIRTYNGWTLYEYKTAFSATSTSISGTGLIDELRIYPADAQMISYTYEPLTGLTTQNDTKGAITYYGYDSFQRLSYIRDLSGKIIKSYCYNYANQTGGGCAVYPNALQTKTYIKSCASGYTSGSGLPYIVPANQFFAATVNEANRLATDYLDLAGQQNADVNGNCTTIACFNYTLSANQGFSANYHYTDCDNVARVVYVQSGSSTTVCAQENSVSGGPYTKGTICQ